MNKRLPNRLCARVASAAGCFLICACLADIASAQVDFLEKLPGLTDLQRNVGVAIDKLCPPIAPGNPSGNPTQRLANTCTLMVVSAAFNEGQGSGLPPSYNL